MTNLATLFYVGIIVPTMVTIIIFTGFLFCWFKCGLRRRLQMISKEGELSLVRREVNVNCDSVRKKQRDKYDNRSQQSNDSAIDVGEMELGFDEVDKMRGKAEVVIDSRTLKSIGKHSYENEMVTTEVDVHTNLTNGCYPSRETLNIEICSQAKIYESVEEAQRFALKIAAVDNEEDDGQPSTSTESPLAHKADLMNAAQKQFSKSPIGGTLQKQPPRYASAHKLIGPPLKLAQSALPGLNDDSNYAVVPTWMHQSDRVGETTRKQELPLYASKEYQPSNLSWNPNIVGSGGSNTDNYSAVEASQV